MTEAISERQAGKLRHEAKETLLLAEDVNCDGIKTRTKWS